MLATEVSKCHGDVMLALRRLKRMLERVGKARRQKQLVAHEKPTQARRRAAKEAVKRRKKLSEKQARRRHSQRPWIRT